MKNSLQQLIRYCTPAIASALVACFVWVSINIWYLSVLQTIFRVIRFGTQSASETSIWYMTILCSAFSQSADSAVSESSLYGYNLPWFVTNSSSELVFGRWFYSILLLFAIVVTLSLAAIHAAASLSIQLWPVPEVKSHRQAVAQLTETRQLWLHAGCGAIAGGLMWFISYPRLVESQVLVDAGQIEPWGVGGLALWFAAFVIPILLFSNCRRHVSGNAAQARSLTGFDKIPLQQQVCPVCHYLLDYSAYCCSECGTDAIRFADIVLRRRRIIILLPSTLVVVLMLGVISAFTFQVKPRSSIWLVAARWLSLSSVDRWNVDGYLLVLPRNELTLLQVDGRTIGCIPYITLDNDRSLPHGESNLGIGLFTITVRGTEIEHGSAQVVSHPEPADSLFKKQPIGANYLGWLGAGRRGPLLLYSSALPIQRVVRTDGVGSIVVTHELDILRNAAWALFRQYLLERGLTFENDCGVDPVLPLPQSFTVGSQRLGAKPPTMRVGPNKASSTESRDPQ